MSWTFVACIGIAFAWMALFYLWGRGFLTFIHSDYDTASCIPFGYLVLQVIYQLIYLPFFLIRGSYRATVYIWLSIVLAGAVGLIVYFGKHPATRKKLKAADIIGIITAGIMVFGLAVYISLHVPFYGQDTRTYISTMNESYYRDSIWIRFGTPVFHSGMCSMFQLFTLSSVLTGIKPYYISLFTVRIVGVSLFSFILYHIGAIVFKGKDNRTCWPALLLAVLVPYLLMFWGSNYTAEFFYWRINEAKGYGQFILLPIGFVVFIAMFKDETHRRTLWKEQLLVGLAAVPVSASSLTPYIFLVFIGAFSLLIFDKMKYGWGTIGRAIICALPNMVYLLIYILEKKEIIVL